MWPRCAALLRVLGAASFLLDNLFIMRETNVTSQRTNIRLWTSHIDNIRADCNLWLLRIDYLLYYEWSPLGLGSGIVSSFALAVVDC